MTAWLAAAIAMLAATLPPLWVCARRSAVDGAAALQLAGVLTALVLVALSTWFGRTTYLDVALVLAVSSVAASLAFARFLERWL